MKIYGLCWFSCKVTQKKKTPTKTNNEKKIINVVDAKCCPGIWKCILVGIYTYRMRSSPKQIYFKIGQNVMLLSSHSWEYKYTVNVGRMFLLVLERQTWSFSTVREYYHRQNPFEFSNVNPSYQHCAHFCGRFIPCVASFLAGRLFGVEAASSLLSRRGRYTRI